MYEKNIKTLWDSSKYSNTYTLALLYAMDYDHDDPAHWIQTLQEENANGRCGSSSNLNNICRNTNKSFVPIHVCLVMLTNEKGEKLIVSSGLNNNDLFLSIKLQKKVYCILTYLWLKKGTYWNSNSRRNSSMYVQCGM